tara:strand:- start:16330 stop:17853 length:1524 start_codon:yes stop_codon:yes gene_type:complete
MSKKNKTAISPTRDENYPEWYQQVIRAADLAENAPVRGCMIIKPWGYALWENMQASLDKDFKKTGHKNVYFPLFIPKSYFEKEAKHVDGFAKECAVVTHSRLEASSEGGLAPAGELDEPLIVRPTSETIIGEAFARWIQSYRDLPLLTNQWANVVRWEMRTRLFLRTSEFLWQEGHTAHATEEEAMAETKQMLDIYVNFVENMLAIPVIPGRKTESERFPGAEETLTFEAMMQDRKALQGGTSHFLGQKFAKASDITFMDKDGQEQYAWTTSWGVTTRMIGAMVMVHSDDNGLVLPPRIAPSQIVILPILKDDETKEKVLEYCESLKAELENKAFGDGFLNVEMDTRDLRGGEKLWHWIKHGIPMFLEIGPRDVDSNALVVGRRDKDPKERGPQSREEFLSTVVDQLEEMQQGLFDKAKAFQQEHTVRIDTKEEFYKFFTPKNKEKPEIHGGFALAHWNGSAEVEEQIKKDLKVTIRVIPNNSEAEEGKCVITGEPSKQRVVFAKAY